MSELDATFNLVLGAYGFRERLDALEAYLCNLRNERPDLNLKDSPNLAELRFYNLRGNINDYNKILQEVQQFTARKHESRFFGLPLARSIGGLFPRLTAVRSVDTSKVMPRSFYAKRDLLETQLLPLWRVKGDF